MPMAGLARLLLVGQSKYAKKQDALAYMVGTWCLLYFDLTSQHLHSQLDFNWSSQDLQRLSRNKPIPRHLKIEQNLSNESDCTEYALVSLSKAT